jgi:hypothetical protein
MNDILILVSITWMITINKPQVINKNNYFMNQVAVPARWLSAAI